jgi:hypothetical protein
VLGLPPTERSERRSSWGAQLQRGDTHDARSAGGRGEGRQASAERPGKLAGRDILAEVLGHGTGLWGARDEEIFLIFRKIY